MRRIGCLGPIVGLLGIAALFLVMQSWGGAGPVTKCQDVGGLPILVTRT